VSARTIAVRRAAAIAVHAALLVLAMLVIAGCGGSGDDGAKDSDARDAKTTSTSDEHDEGDGEEHPDEDEPGDPTEVPDPVPEGELPPIQVRSPEPLSYVSRSFILAGSAQVFEGDLRWAILDANLKPMAQGRMTASCGAPCRGNFRTRIPLAGVQVGSWELHVWQPPVADGDPARVHDTMVPITVTAEPVDAPDPGATPPGGVPGG
jgi:hypothetical protein